VRGAPENHLPAQDGLSCINDFAGQQNPNEEVNQEGKTAACEDARAHEYLEDGDAPDGSHLRQARGGGRREAHPYSRLDPTQDWKIQPENKLSEEAIDMIKARPKPKCSSPRAPMFDRFMVRVE